MGIPIRIQIKTFECPCIIPSKLSVKAILICLKATWYKYNREAAEGQGANGWKIC